MPPTPPRQRTRRQKLIDMRAIAKLCDREYQTVRSWRGYGMPRPVTTRGQSPLFDRDEVVAWLKQTLRLTPDGEPQFLRTPERNTKTRRKPAT